MEKGKFNLTEEQLDRIEKCFEMHDVVELKSICTDLELKLEELKTFDIMSYKLLEYIESNDELVQRLREISKNRKGLQKLFPYYQKPENIRYIVDHKEEYKLSNVELKKIEELCLKGISRNISGKLDKQHQKRDKFWKKHGFKIAVVFELLLVIFVYNVYLKQYFKTGIIKKYEITDAIILENSLSRYAGDYYTVNADIKYEYTVNSKKYVKEDREMLIGIGDALKNKQEGTSMKIYYEKENPSNVRIYQEGKIWSITFVMTSILMIIILIKLIFWNK